MHGGDGEAQRDALLLDPARAVPGGPDEPVVQLCFRRLRHLTITRGSAASDGGNRPARERRAARWRPAACREEGSRTPLRGGGGNRTRVLQNRTRASPGAVCSLFLSPTGPADKPVWAQSLFAFPFDPATGSNGEPLSTPDPRPGALPG